MATVVETFYVEETVNLIHDNDALAKWNEKVNELGLEGQKTVVKTDKSPIPFLWMNEALVSAFEVLCPSKTEMEKYDKTPIPLELLEVVSLCKREDYFDLVEVWFNEREKDPVIIGYKYNLGSSESDWWRKSRGDKYLIGRWADVKASLDALVKRAKNLFFQSETLRLKQQIRDSQRHLEDLESIIERKFGNAMPITDDLPF